MRKLKRRKRVNKAINKRLICPIVDLANGQVMRQEPRFKKDRTSLQHSYLISAELLEDESPIRRLKVWQNNNFLVMPLGFWELLLEELPAFIDEVKAELKVRGVPECEYKEIK